MTLWNKYAACEYKCGSVTLSPRHKETATSFFLSAWTQCTQVIMSQMLLTFLASPKNPCFHTVTCPQAHVDACACTQVTC